MVTLQSVTFIILLINILQVKKRLVTRLHFFLHFLRRQFNLSQMSKTKGQRLKMQNCPFCNMITQVILTLATTFSYNN